MAKYRIQVAETCTYEVEVDAENARDARQNALDILVSRENANDHIASLDDRRVILVERVVAN